MRQLKITNSITNRESQPLKKYLREIGKEERITAQEEVELAKKIKQGDQNALERLTRANLRFVVSVAKQYQYQGLTLPDLINEGNRGLIEAAKRFDHTRGFKFISYAVYWIRQSILQALAEQSRIVRLPMNQLNSVKKMNDMFAKLEQEYDRPPTVDELSVVLEMSTKGVANLMRLSSRHVSVDAPLDEGESKTLLDILPNSRPGPSTAADKQSLAQDINRFLSILFSPRDADIIKLYFGIDEQETLTLEEIGAKFNLTRERVRQIKEKSLKIMKNHPSISNQLRSYLE